MNAEAMKKAFNKCLAVLDRDYPDLPPMELEENMKRRDRNHAQLMFHPRLMVRHAKWMCLAGCGFVDEGRFDKANRWLGFIQGSLWMGGFASIDNMKDWNKGDGEHAYERVVREGTVELDDRDAHDVVLCLSGLNWLSAGGLISAGWDGAKARVTVERLSEVAQVDETCFECPKCGSSFFGSQQFSDGTYKRMCHGVSACEDGTSKPCGFVWNSLLDADYMKPTGRKVPRTKVVTGCYVSTPVTVGQVLTIAQPPERTPDGHINNCALANGDLEQNCQVCGGNCPDRYKFGEDPK